jgi:prolyl-tRNA synthetase
VLYDDRETTAGIKFNDADLVGIPVQVILGSKNVQKGLIEIRRRGSADAHLVERAAAGEEIQKLLDKMK